MCERLADLRTSMSAYAAEFDSALVSVSDASRVVGEAAAIEKMAATVKGLAAARVAETDAWRGDGDRSPAHHLARTTGTTVGAAADAITAARRLERLPETAAAARRGELSTSQVSAIADAATADPASETRLVDQARWSSLQELKDDCARTRAAASVDAEARRKRIHDRRSLRTYTDSEGAWHMHVANNADVGAEIMAVIDPIRDRLFATARVQGRREPSEAYAADALTTLAREATASTAATAGNHAREADAHSGGVEAPGPSPASDAATGSDGNAGAIGGSAATDSATSDSRPAGPASSVPATARADAGSRSTPAQPTTRPAARAKIIVRVDLGALLRGYPVAGEVAELVGFGPVAVSAIRDMINSGDPFLTAVATRGIDVVGVAHLGRRPTAHQRTALEWLYPTCAVEGCSAVARLEMDHREDWAATRVTLFSLIDRLCPHHHRLKTRDNWALVDGRGKRAFVPPTDPRHPRRPTPT